MKALKKVVICMLVVLPGVGTSYAGDCLHDKSFANHVYTVIQGGANLHKTLSMFEASKGNSLIIKELYANKDKINSVDMAESMVEFACRYNQLQDA